MQRKAFGRAGLTGLCLCCLVLPVVAGEGPEEESVLLTVNDEPVYTSEVRLAMQTVSSRAQQRGEQVDANQAMEMAIKEVVSTRLLLQEARRQEVVVDTERAAQMLQRVEQQAGGRSSLEAELGKMGVPYDRFIQVINDAELIQAYVESKISPTVSVSDQEVADFYKDNPEVFATPPQVRARHILFKTEQDAAAEDLKAAETRAEAARQRALDGEDFAELARELSEGPSGPRGGDLGFFSAERMVPAFSEAAFALEQGGISGVVKTQFGFHVIKVEERRDAGTMDLQEVATQLKEQMKRQQISEKLAALADDLQKTARVVAVDPPPAAEEGEPAEAPETAEND